LSLNLRALPSSFLNEKFTKSVSVSVSVSELFRLRFGAEHCKAIQAI